MVKLPKSVKKIIKMFKKQNSMVKGGLCLVVLYIVYYLFKQMRWIGGNNSYLEGLGGSDKKFVFFKMNGCPHCVKMTPEWKAAKAQNKTDVVMTDYERGSTKGGELCKKYGVTGFPTILLLQGGKKKDIYKGERTKGGIMSYLKSL